VLLVLAAVAWGLVASPTRAAFPGENGHFALVSNIAGPDFDIYGFRPAPFHVMTYTTDSTFADSEMQYSADGKRIVFSSNRDAATTDIYTMNTDGTGLTRITTDAAPDVQPTFSPDGTKIAFTRQFAGPPANWDIFVKNADGTGAETNLTNTPTTFDGYPSWAPNNSKIAFATNRVGNQFDIWTMNPNGTSPAVVLSLASQEIYPDYSPDATRIAAQTNFGGNNNIFTMTTAGTGVVALTSNGASDAIPFYSPDGTKVGFTSNRAGNNNLYTVNAAGPAEAGLQQWTSNAANEVGFDWQPVFPADLATSKSDTPDPAPVGSNVTYTLRLEHQGGGDATGVYLVDTLPANVTFVSASPGCSHSAGTVLCATNYIRAGEFRTFDVTVKTTQTGAINNRVEVLAGQSDPDTSDNVWNEQTTVRPLQADLSVTKAATPESVAEGQELTYTVTAANAGPEDAPNLVVTDTLPSTVNFVSASPGCTEADGTVTCTAANLAPGAEAVYEIVVDTTADGTITNVVAVSSDREDPDPVNNTFSLDTAVTALIADLSIQKTDAPDPVGVGDDLTYTLQVNNAGPDTATDVVVDDTLPGSVTFVSASTGCTHMAGTVTCSTASLPSADGATFEIVVRPTAEGVITNTASVTSAVGDSNLENNTVSTETTVAKIATRLEARPLFLDILPTVKGRVGTVEATLTRADTGAPISGGLIVFTAGETELCRATTLGDGVARCTVQVPKWLVAALSLGYDATFAGDSRFLGSSDHAPLVRVSGVIEVL
jgi:uncharacterized repeat protein (TIGR01451 family)